MKHFGIVFGAAALGGSLFACAIGLDGFAGGGATTRGVDPAMALDSGDGTTHAVDAPLDASDGSARSSCPTGHGPDMGSVDVGPGVGFCIDSTEVTNRQYSVFLNTSPTVTNQPPYCQGNASFAPSDPRFFDDPLKENFPVTYVDWCDARAFCLWAGKRLCGRIGGGGVPNPVEQIAPRVSQTAWACTNGSTQLYPYGTSYMPGVCNAQGTGTIEPVRYRAGCVGGVPGVYDLVGNVAEWLDDCAQDVGPADSCPTNSSTFTYVANNDGKAGGRCDHMDERTRMDTSIDLGFRCCSD